MASLQAIRGIAALLVVALHSMNMTQAFSGTGWSRHLFDALQYCGNFGVDLFFVLSGFVISALAIRSAAAPQDSLVFLFRRAARVFPLFWLSFAAAFFVKIPGADSSMATFLSQPLAMLLLQTPAALRVSWTLVYEIQFYLVAAVLMLFGRNARLAFICWAFVEVALVLLAANGSLYAIPLTNALSLQFCAGILLGLFSRQIPAPYPKMMMLAGALAVIGVGLLFDPIWIATTHEARAFLWGIPASMIIWGAVSAEQDGLTFPKWLRWQGDISYSVYMLHQPILTAVWMSLASVGMMAGTVGAILYLCISSVLIIAGGALSFTFIETAINRFAHRGDRLKPKLATPARPPCRSFVSTQPPAKHSRINIQGGETERQPGSISKNPAKGLPAAHGRLCGPTPSKSTMASGCRVHPVHMHSREDSR
jgi:exopolysaccharide production protein ExoZ